MSGLHAKWEGSAASRGGVPSARQTHTPFVNTCWLQGGPRGAVSRFTSCRRALSAEHSARRQTVLSTLPLFLTVGGTGRGVVVEGSGLSSGHTQRYEGVVIIVAKLGDTSVVLYLSFLVHTGWMILINFCLLVLLVPVVRQSSGADLYHTNSGLANDNVNHKSCEYSRACVSVIKVTFIPRTSGHPHSCHFCGCFTRSNHVALLKYELIYR